MKKILCLDFDGVIFDSQKECLYNSYIVYNRYLNPDFKIESFDQIPIDVIETFLKYRYLVKPAKQYWQLMDLIIQGSTIPNQHQFDKLSLENEKILDSFQKKFFDNRKNLVKNDPNFFFGLYQIYKQFSNYWDVIKNKFEVHLVTNRDFFSVSNILKRNRIFFDSKKLWTSDLGLTKIEIIEDIVTNEKVTKESVFFIDDHPDYVIQLDQFGINSFLAKWGYNDYSGDSINKIDNIGDIISKEF